MAKVLSKEEWKRRKKLYAYAKLAVAGLLAMLILLVVLFGVLRVARNLFSRSGNQTADGQTMKQELGITELFLTKNEYSRPGNALKEVKGIVIHYVADSGSSAIENRNYYESLKNGSERTAESCHFIIDIDGDIIQCIPLDEVACASGSRNEDTIAITICHPTTDGQPTDATYQALVQLTAYLCKQYGLDKAAVLRHSDFGVASCPKYFTEQEGKWAAFVAEVETIAGTKK